MCTSPQKISTSRIDYSLPIQQVKSRIHQPHSKIQGCWTQLPLQTELWLFQGYGPWGNRAVKKFLSGRLIMNSRPLWNFHQRHKFLRAKASREILEFNVSETPFAGVFRGIFPPQTPCCFVRIHTRLGTMPLKYPRHFTTWHGLDV